jgi:homogentisate phytyltransferase/homogentisate geranylgeranyltransferase
MTALLTAYAGMILIAPPLLRHDAEPIVLAGGHAAAAALLLYWAKTANPRHHTKFSHFYMRVWALFFLEYILVPGACLAT